MQKELTSKLKLTIAKLELKQLEFIDKISVRHNDYVIRCITCPDTNEFLAVNGDWETVTNFKEKDCIGRKWTEFIPKSEDVLAEIFRSIDGGGFESYICDILKKDGSTTSVNWKSKFFPEINAIVTIGRAQK